MNASEVRPGRSTVPEHLSGSKDSWHGAISSDGPFEPEANRYHLYIGLFCPFAHRPNLVRHLKGLQDAISMSVVRPYPKGDDAGWPGWRFPKDVEEYPGATPDALFGSEYLHDIYFKADAQYGGRYSVPVLWDKKTKTIVNNESTDLLRNLTHAFDDLITDPRLKRLDLYPESLRTKIDEICQWMQRDLNTGVYKAGFATDQETYNANVPPVFAALNKVEKIIAAYGGPFVLGKRLTEVDIRLYPTAIRFDVVYVQHFKCNLGMIRSHYPQINNWMKGLYWGFAELEDGSRPSAFRNVEQGGTVDFKHIKENYTKSHGDINPKAITPVGPLPDVEEGFESDFVKVAIGGVKTKEVLECENALY